MNWSWLWLLVVLTGLHGPVWVNTSQVSAVYLAPAGVGATTTAIAMSSGQIFYVRESVAEAVEKLRERT